MALETECILRPNLGTSADVLNVPSRTSMLVHVHVLKTFLERIAVAIRSLDGKILSYV